MEVVGAVGTITLDRPSKRNAVTYAMWTELGAASKQLAHDDAVHVVVVRGAGEHFCAGADIAELLIARPEGELGYGRAGDGTGRSKRSWKSKLKSVAGETARILT